MNPRTRGERNNNPGNIRRTAIAWKGELPDDGKGDREFEIFKSPEYGVRALAKILLHYQAEGFDTLAEIIPRYAPAVENDTRAYLRAVCNATGFSSGEPVRVSDYNRMRALVEAIITHENGRCIYAPEVLDAGIRLAMPTA